MEEFLKDELLKELKNVNDLEQMKVLISNLIAYLNTVNDVEERIERDIKTRLYMKGIR